MQGAAFDEVLAFADDMEKGGKDSEVEKADFVSLNYGTLFTDRHNLTYCNEKF